MTVIILGTILAVVVIGGLMVRYGVYPIRKDSYLELKDVIREKMDELRYRKKKKKI